MYHIDNPEHMTPDQRFREVAAILAAGYLRLRQILPHHVTDADVRGGPESSTSTEKPLDSPHHQSPHGHGIDRMDHSNGGPG